MRQKSETPKPPAEQVVKDIRRATRKLHSSEEKIRIVLSGLRGEDSIAELCRKEGLCCTTPVRDSSCESSMVAGWHEQTPQDGMVAALPTRHHNVPRWWY
jgi:transposase